VIAHVCGVCDVTEDMCAVMCVCVCCREQVLPHHLERNRKGKSSHSEQEEGDQGSWYLYINEDDLPPGERVDCEMKLGSVVFFNNTIPHCSGDNTYHHLVFLYLFIYIYNIYIYCV